MRKFLSVLVVMLAGCVSPPQQPPAPEPAAPVPQPAAPAAGPSQAWVVAASRLEVRVFRDGAMAKFAHNHVITSTGIRGRIELREPRTATSFEFELPLDSFVIDDPAARAAAGADFSSSVKDSDREGTRRNMLGPALLDSERQPVLKLVSDGLEGGPRDYRVRVRVQFRGGERTITVPVTVTEEGGRLRMRAAMKLRHADLGLKPFTAGLGAISVREDFEVACDLEARPAT